ncbi:MAG: SDR family NAD(P)-dependent oxidoreductase [Bacteroidales bacterium]
MKKILILGASSGIGRMLAQHYAERGYTVGITARRTALLSELQAQFPAQIHAKTLDICSPHLAQGLTELASEMGGMDILCINAGVGQHEEVLEPQVEQYTLAVNVMGFTQASIWGYNYFKASGTQGQIVATASVASVCALRQSPAYSASKRYMRHYIDCLAQRAYHDKLPLTFTTLLPGFIATDLLQRKYPFTVSLSKVRGSIIRAIDRKKREAYVPARWAVLAFLFRFMPKGVWERFF